MSIWNRISEALSALTSGESLASVFEKLRTPPERSVAFAIAVIALGAKMAKADGQVTRDEVTAFREVFQIARDDEAGAARVCAVPGWMESPPVRQGGADRIYANAAVNLSPEKERVFRAIARALRPGGRAALADVAVEEMPGWLREVCGHYSPSLAGAAGAEELRRGLEEAGLEARIAETVPYGEELIAEMIRGETIPGAEEARKALGPLVTGRLVARAARDLAGKVSRILVEAVRPEG